MKLRTAVFLLTTVLLWGGSVSANTAPEVTNVIATQRVGTHLVDITYNLLDADGDAMTITVFLSTDGGASYSFQCTALTGNAGTGIVSGIGLTVTWDAGVDYPGFSSSTCSIRVIADDNFVAPASGLDMFILLDRTTSMTANNRWGIATSDLGNFFLLDAGSAGVSAALNFFPVAGAVDQCDPALYNPPQVALGVLNAHAPVLNDAMSTESPGGSTVWYPSLQGTLAAAQVRQEAFPDHTVIVVLITDGTPVLCETNLASIADLAASALNGFGVLTYTVGLQGSTSTELDVISAAGGTTSSYSTPDPPLLWTTMIAIRDDALSR